MISPLKIDCQFKNGQTSYSFDLSKKLIIQQPINVFLDPNVPKSKNVFGLPNTYEKPEYRVEKGHSVNCMSIALCPHAEPQWESVYHLLDLSQDSPPDWNWENHFGFQPALLLTLETSNSNEIECDYPDKDIHISRLANLDSLKNALNYFESALFLNFAFSITVLHFRINETRNLHLHQSELNFFSRVILIRFSFENNLISPDEALFGQLSCCAAQYIKKEFNPCAIAVQAPSFDRSNCLNCDTHRVLFDLHRNPPQKSLHLNQKASQIILGENFVFPKELEDGKYVIQIGGVDFKNQDAVISCSYLYQVDSS